MPIRTRVMMGVAGSLGLAIMMFAVSGQAYAQTSISGASAERIAQQAVPGSVLIHESQDTSRGTPVWDIHVNQHGAVWDIKVSQATGQVLVKRRVQTHSGGEQSTGEKHRRKPSADGAESNAAKTGSSTSTRTIQSILSGGVLYGVKMTKVPSIYQPYVNRALAQAHGKLKWVKFMTAAHGNVQMNIKIRLATGGSTKVTDLFSPTTHQLLSSRTSSDS